MAQNTFALMTNLGRAKEAAAIANGTALVITHIAIGDGTTVPSGGETSLYHEVARKAVSGHGTVVGASNVAYFDIFLEASEGPYTIREAGLIDQDGDLIAIARYDPPISKPIPSSGQTVEGTIRLEVAFSNIANITIVVDPSFKVEMQRLARLPWVSVISMSETAPPTNPIVGDMYVVAPGATGAWSGQAGKIAEHTPAGWAIITPSNGHGISLPDGRVFERVEGAYIEKLALDAQSGRWIYAVAGGTANALTASLVPAPSDLTTGLVLRLKISNTNTGAATLSLNGLGAKPIVRSGGLALKVNDLPAGAIAELTYDGGRFQLSALSTSTLPPPPSVVNFNVPGTQNWSVPDGVYVIEVEVWGGGGGGAGSVSGGSSNAADYAGEGGGGGGYSRGAFNVTPGQVLAVTVGSGGSPGPGGNIGGDGGTSSVGALISATGGQAGRVASASTGTPSTYGRQGGIGIGGQVNLVGGWGNVVSKQGSFTYPGAGGSAPLGGQGAISSSTAPSEAGSPGGGGGGSGGSGVIPGSAGAPGRVTIKY